MTNTLKRCSRCREEKALEAFRKNASRKDGLHPECKTCQSARVAADYKAHPEKVKARVLAWEKAHPEQEKARLAARYSVHPEQEKARGRARYKAHPEKERARRAAYSKAHPEQGRTRDHRRRARKLGAPGSHTTAEWQACLAYYDGYCAYCGQADTPTKDHWTPLARGGSNDIGNLRAACRSCNCSKGTLIGPERAAWLRGVWSRVSPRAA